MAAIRKILVAVKIRTRVASPASRRRCASRAVSAPEARDMRVVPPQPLMPLPV